MGATADGRPIHKVTTERGPEYFTKEADGKFKSYHDEGAVKLVEDVKAAAKGLSEAEIAKNKPAFAKGDSSQKRT